jgi:hypothetical protein
MNKMMFAALLGICSASAGTIQYYAYMNGAAEAPPNGSPASGFTRVTVDDVANTLRVQAWFSDLQTGSTVAHIHCCTPVAATGTAGVATPTPTFPGFPAGVTSGSYDSTFDMTLASSYRPAYLATFPDTAAAQAALFAGIADGKAYFNLHTSGFPGGEIRGFLVPVPEPSTLSLAGLALAGLIFARRRK